MFPGRKPVRRRSRRNGFAAQARRLLAIAAVLDGTSREDAAAIGGSGRALFSHRRPAGGESGLRCAKRPGLRGQYAGDFGVRSQRAEAAELLARRVISITASTHQDRHRHIDIPRSRGCSPAARASARLRPPINQPNVELADARRKPAGGLFALGRRVCVVGNARESRAWNIIGQDIPRTRRSR